MVTKVDAASKRRRPSTDLDDADSRPPVPLIPKEAGAYAR